jgi:DNA-binding NarL/FixJ family response regulator
MGLAKFRHRRHRSMKVLIADHHEVVRLGLSQWLKNHTIIEAINADEAIRLYKKHKPDVVVLESRLPGDGLECLARIKGNVLMFSGYDNPTYIARAVALGARGYLLKGVDCKEFLSAIKKVAAGEDVWSDEIIQRVSGALPKSAGLTPREGEVLKQLAFGLTNKEIALAMGISYETVKEHVQHLLKKLGMSDRTQAAVWAVKEGLV